MSIFLLRLSSLAASAKYFSASYFLKTEQIIKEKYPNTIVTLQWFTRKESRGAHYRTDFPQTNDECVHSIITKEDKVPDYVK